VNIKENRGNLQILLGCLLGIGSIVILYVIFKTPSLSSVELQRNARNTKTALAMTERVLMGPFPTGTRPTATVTKTPSITPTSTLTPTRTPSPTLIHYFIDTSTPRTGVPNSRNTAPPLISTAPAAINTPVPPIQPTSAPPIQPTSLPPVQPTPCLNPQGHPITCH